MIFPVNFAVVEKMSKDNYSIIFRMDDLTNLRQVKDEIVYCSFFTDTIVDYNIFGTMHHVMIKIPDEYINVGRFQNNTNIYIDKKKGYISVVDETSTSKSYEELINKNKR